MLLSFDSFTPFYTTFKNSNKVLPVIIDHYFAVGPTRARAVCSFFGFSLVTRGYALTESD